MCVYVSMNKQMQVENVDLICMFGFFFKNQVLMQRVICEVRALAVLPTKELAQQVRTKKELSII